MRILIVNFQSNVRYPALGPAYLMAVLQGAGQEVKLLDLTSHGVRTAHRGQRRETTLSSIMARARMYASHSPWMQPFKGPLKQLKKTSEAFRASRTMRPALDLAGRWHAESPFDLALISTAGRFRECNVLARYVGDEWGIPVVVGGPQFGVPEVARSWASTGAFQGVCSFEAELYLVPLIRILESKEPLNAVPGVYYMDEIGVRDTGPPGIVENLDELPFPDFSAFRMNQYNDGVLPILATRGCSWGHCVFCSDPSAVTCAFRFRKRSTEHVMAELSHQRDRYGMRRFIFLDEEVNADMDSWVALLEAMVREKLGVIWIGALQSVKGLRPEILRLSYKAGMRAIAPGLESGSQRVLNLMRKGTTVERNAALIRNAHSAGLNVRVSILYGFPGESADDLEETLRFLKAHEVFIHKLWLSKFAITMGSPFHRQMEKYLAEGLIKNPHPDPITGLVYHENPVMESPDYQRAIYRIRALASRINRRGYTGEARDFDAIL
ncbi:MAG: radical SAM protein [Deltaproteobacteria bacterium]|nr:radical SAM protein [Deltaproteobacteria bacterium]